MFKYILLLCLLVFVTMGLCACQELFHTTLPQKPTDEPVAGPSIGPLNLPGDLVGLSFSERSSYFKRVQGYDFRAEDGEDTAYFWMANEDEPYTVPVDQKWVNELTEIVRQYNMVSWDGLSGYASSLLDGTHFAIDISFSDGTAVHANGYGKFPGDYSEASTVIDAHFMQLLPKEMRDW